MAIFVRLLTLNWNGIGPSKKEKVFEIKFVRKWNIELETYVRLIKYFRPTT